MNRWICCAFLCALALMFLAGTAMADPDVYVGDTAIYGGQTVSVKPNVLIILDTSGSMTDTVPDVQDTTYDSATSYNTTNNCYQYVTVTRHTRRGRIVTSHQYQSTTCDANEVYYDSGRRRHRWVDLTSLANVNTSCGGVNPHDALSGVGFWKGNGSSLNSDGTCASPSRGGSYQTGNYINWDSVNSNSGTGQTPKIDIARKVLHDLVATTSGVNFGLMVFDQTGHANGGQFYRGTSMDGVGSGYLTTIKDMDTTYKSGITDRQALLAIIDNGATVKGGTPLAETLYEAMLYFEGQNSAFNPGTSYTSPITASCQKNYVVLITDGMSSADTGYPPGSSSNVFDNLSGCTNGDCDGDGNEPQGNPKINYNSSGSGGTDYLDDVAKYIFDHDMDPNEPGKQNVVTYPIFFGNDPAAIQAGAEYLLQDTADNGQGKAAGQGTLFTAANTQGLSKALSNIMTQIIAQNSSFVAPVVPTSPENRTKSGDRVYLGFFKPVTGDEWEGNLKKYGLDSTNGIVDQTGAVATDTSSGAFKNSAVSYWTASSSPDGGKVDAGGAGAELAASDLSTRKVYTDLGTSNDLTDSSNAFTTANSGLTAADLNVADATAKDTLINYVRGIDVYDQNQNGSTTDNRDWILGDILHSRPAIVNYNSYGTTAEGTCPGSWTGVDSNTANNKTVIYVGANDGMLHAFSDCDGKELWGFIPDNLLDNLVNLGGTDHTYFVDGSPATYIYDQNGDGVIDPATDKVVLIFGERRGGGINTLQAGVSRGAYYALDVTNPGDPKLLWTIDSATLDANGNPEFPELGETWSKPSIGKVMVDGTPEIVAFVGAGYDNNEDLRYGDTQDFPASTASTDTTQMTNDEGAFTSLHPANGGQVNAQGRGIYAVKVATLDVDGVPTLAKDPTNLKVWGWTHQDGVNDPDTNPSFSIPSQLAAVDSDYNGYIDRVYAGDTGGNLWRCSVGSNSVSDWACQRIFTANPSDAARSDESPVTNGRKIFYRPSVTIDADSQGKYFGVYFGTGDRAHPLNTDVVDRMYFVKDRGQSTAKTEADLVNVTKDYLQAQPSAIDYTDANNAAGLTGANQATDLNSLIQNTLTSLGTDDGWFIKLNQTAGEKVLASPLIYHGVASFTTYAPTSSGTSDPCSSGTLGTASLYQVDYKTGEAVFNYDTNNDYTGTSQQVTNARASGGDGGQVLRRSDRKEETGSGIPSGAVRLPGKILIGSGGGIFQEQSKQVSSIIPIYWLQE